MNIDVSEVKSFRECKRKWAFSSRNKWHLRSRAPKPVFLFGTLFHEGLHNLYLGASLEKVLEMCERELTDPAEIRTITAMLSGYAENQLGNDLAKYHVLDIEHKFQLEVPPFDSLGITLCGSIDMIAVDRETNEVWGFEHKTCSKFRSPLYSMIDEQPRLYTIALKQYIDKMNEVRSEENKLLLGGIYLNEVRKVQRTFDMKRTVCTYSEVDLQNFMKGFYITCEGIHQAVGEGVALPDPGYMKCGMCEFAEICNMYKYTEPDKADVLDEFAEEFMERDVDHLDEKLERVVQE